MEVKPFDQYVVKVHGSRRLTARNRKILRKITPYAQDNTLPARVYSPVQDHGAEAPLETRRSTRVRREPDRLEVEWKGKSYEKQPPVVNQQDCLTASHSLAYSNCLIPARPGGGEGIYGGGSADNLWVDKHRSTGPQLRQPVPWNSWYGSHIGYVGWPGWN